MTVRVKGTMEFHSRHLKHRIRRSGTFFHDLSLSKRSLAQLQSHSHTFVAENKWKSYEGLPDRSWKHSLCRPLHRRHQRQMLHNCVILLMQSYLDCSDANRLEMLGGIRISSRGLLREQPQTKSMEENLASTSSSQPLSPPPSFESTKLKHQNPSTESSLSSPLPPSVTRLWRPAAQRNLRNQWSKMASYRQQWKSFSSSARSHATSIVNSYLSQRYMNAMELGVLSDMPDIRKKACWKLFKQQKLHRSKLLSSYKDMVDVVMHTVKTSRSMRTFLKGSSSPLVQFSSISEDKNDHGDGRGIPVYAFWSISYFEELAQELVQMFTLELNLKRLLVVELLSISSEEVPVNGVCWLDEIYPGEFDDLCICGLYSTEVCEPVRPKIKDWKSDMSSEQSNRQPDHDILQVYLTTWLAEVNIDTYRVDEIFAVVGEEMHVSLS